MATKQYNMMRKWGGSRAPGGLRRFNLNLRGAATMGKCVAAMDFKSVLEDDNWYNTHVNLSAVTDLPDDASAEDKKLAEAKVLRAEQDAKLGVMIMAPKSGVTQRHCGE